MKWLYVHCATMDIQVWNIESIPSKLKIDCPKLGRKLTPLMYTHWPAQFRMIDP